jgi:Spy/CpxP family protein refolding chaperone
MKEILVKLGITAVAVISIAAAQALPSLQQYSTQNFQSGIAMVNSEGGMNQLALLTKMLSLTASQQQQTKTILDQEETAAKPLVEQLNEAWDSLASAEKAGAPESEIDVLARNIGNLSGEILALDAKAQSKIYGQLSAEQKQRVEQLPHPFFAPSAPLLPPGPVLIFDAHGPN